MAGVHGAGGDAAGLRSFEDAKSTLYGTISAAGAALEKASKCVLSIGASNVHARMVLRRGRAQDSRNQTKWNVDSSTVRCSSLLDWWVRSRHSSSALSATPGLRTNMQGVFEACLSLIQINASSVQVQHMLRVVELNERLLGYAVVVVRSSLFLHSPPLSIQTKKVNCDERRSISRQNPGEQYAVGTFYHCTPCATPSPDPKCCV